MGTNINLELNFSSFIGIIMENIIRLKRCLFDEYLLNEYYPKHLTLYQMENDNYDNISMKLFSDTIDSNKYCVLYFGSCS